MKSLALLLAFVLSGCATATTIDVRWSNAASIRAECGRDKQGCYRGNIIFVPRPSGFDDRFALCVLGHEVYHVLGATHSGEVGC